MGAPMIRPCFAVAASISLSVFGQVEVPRVSEVVEVRVTNLEVIVTDEKGERVHGLTKDDFEVFDSGKQQEITNFSEISGEVSTPMTAARETRPAATPLEDVPPRHLIIVFDNFSTNTLDRKRVSTGLRELFRDFRPVDDAMIVSWNRYIEIVVPPTSDRDRLQSGLVKAARQISRGPAGFSSPPPPMAEIPLPGARSAGASARRLEAADMRRRGREAIADQRASVEALKSIIARVAGLDGRKALILVTAAFSIRQESNDAPPELEDGESSSLLRSLTTAANAAGIPIYPIYASGLHSGMSVIDSSGDESMARSAASGSSITGLGYLAGRTGGLVTAYTNGFAAAAARIADDLSRYYSIGYRSSLVRDDREREIKVVARNKSLRVRARRGAVARSHEKELSDRLIAALLFQPDGNQLNISARALMQTKKSRHQYSIPIDVTIPMGSLTYSSDEQGLAADISIFIASADKKGHISSVERFRQRIAVTREQLPSLKNQHYTYGLSVDLRSVSSENRIAIAVLDNVARTTGVVTLTLRPSARALRPSASLR